MPGVKPFFLKAKVIDVMPAYNVAYVQVVNGNVYNIKPNTPGIIFNNLKKGQIVEIEITNRVIRVLSARIIE